MTAVAFFGIKFIRPIELAATVDFHCNDGVAELRYCDKIDGCLADPIVNLGDNDTTAMTCSVCKICG